jgi:hypothetical protein
MAATNFTPISLYYSTTASAAPTTGNLVNGELAINITDGKLFYKDNAAAVQVIGWKTTPATAGGTGQTTYTTGDIIYASATNTISKLGIGSTNQVLTVVGGVPAWAASTGGVTSFSAGTTGFTPNTGTTGAITLAGTLNVANGGTGLSSTPANGALDIGNGSGFTRTTLTQGTGITITNASGSITIATSGGGGGGTGSNLYLAVNFGGF